MVLIYNNYFSDAPISTDDSTVKLSIETLEELDWCLEQLETMQTHRSVSDMASSKVRKKILFTYYYICHITNMYEKSALNR